MQNVNNLGKSGVNEEKNLVCMLEGFAVIDIRQIMKNIKPTDSVQTTSGIVFISASIFYPSNIKFSSIVYSKFNRME